MALYLTLHVVRLSNLLFQNFSLNLEDHFRWEHCGFPWMENQPYFGQPEGKHMTLPVGLFHCYCGDCLYYPFDQSTGICTWNHICQKSGLCRNVEIVLIQIHSKMQLIYSILWNADFKIILTSCICSCFPRVRINDHTFLNQINLVKTFPESSGI